MHKKIPDSYSKREGGNTGNSGRVQLVAPEYPTMHRAGPGAVHCWILRRTLERPIEPYLCSLVSTIDGSTLPQDCVEEQLC